MRLPIQGKKHIDKYIKDVIQLIVDKMFEPKFLNLEHKYDAKVRELSKGRPYHVFAKKVINYIHVQFENFFKQYLSNILVKLAKNHKSGIAPYQLYVYRSKIWNHFGAINCRKIIDKIAPNEDLYRNSYAFQHLFHNQLLDLFRKKEIRLIESKNYDLKPTTIDSDNNFVYFDGLYFFNGGHLPALEMTIDNLIRSKKSVSAIFLIDENMILLPKLAEAIIKKLNSYAVFDVQSFPLCLPTREKLRGILKIDQRISHLLQDKTSCGANDGIIFTDDFIFNPILCFRSCNYPKLYSERKSWVTKYKKIDSYNIVKDFAFDKNLRFSSTKNEYVVVHLRNSTFIASNIRDTKSPKQRKHLFSMLIKAGYDILVIGIGDSTEKIYMDGLYYMDEWGRIPDSLQVHAINGAICMVGSPSGITHLTYCTETPTLVIDLPFPFYPYNACSYRVLLKRLQSDGKKKSIVEYFKIALAEYRDSGANSPLHRKGFELLENTDEQIFGAICELLNNSTTQEVLPEYLDPTDIDNDNLIADINSIRRLILSQEDLDHRFPPLDPKVLSSYNWGSDN